MSAQVEQQWGLQCTHSQLSITCSQVHKQERKSSFLHFVTSVCAIVGGVFTVSGIVDSFIYHGQQVVRKKVDLGKFS